MTPPPLPLDAWSRRQLLAGAAVALALPVTTSLAATPAPALPIDWKPLQMLDDLGGGAAHWVGLPVLVVFWATWCPFCKRHNAHVEKLYQRSQGQPFRIVGVTDETDKDKIKRYVFANQFHFPVAMAPAAFRTQFTQRRVIPLTCLVGPDGHVMQVFAGEMAEDDVMSLGTTLMAAKPRIESV